MKRCPQCNRVETDDALAFCRADGTPLVIDSSSLNSEDGTARFGATAVAPEIETSILMEDGAKMVAFRVDMKPAEAIP